MTVHASVLAQYRGLDFYTIHLTVDSGHNSSIGPFAERTLKYCG
jgi:hypothetical protein